MPETRIEWAILAVGVVVIAALRAAIAQSVRDDSQTARDTSAAAPATTTADPAAMAPPPVTAAAPTPPPRRKPKPKHAAPPAPATGGAARPDRPKPAQDAVRLRLTASRGASWLEVRSGSASGTVLFSGTLARGTTKLFRAARLWVRFGGASNLDAWVNSRAVALRFGTYDTLVTADGLRPPA